MERIANKKGKGQLYSWGTLLRSSFLPVIRQRGRRYANWGRVRLNEVSHEKILATVQGSRPYSVSVTKKASEDDKVAISCNCPFFKQGYPCKHIWASIVEADRVLARETSDLPKVKDPYGSPTVKKADWRALFAEDLWKKDLMAPPWSDGSGQFVLSYELNISPVSTKISAIERYLKKDGTFGRERGLQASTIEHRGLPKVDRGIIAILDNVCRRKERFYSRFYQPTHQNLKGLVLRSRDLELILPLLAETERCRVLDSVKGLLADPLRKANLPEVRLELTVEQRTKEEGKAFKILPFLQLGQEGKSISLRDIPAFFHTLPVLFIWDGYLLELPGPSLSWIEAILKSEEVEISREDVRELLVHVESLPGNLKIEMPEGMGPKAVQDLAPRPLLIIGLGEGYVKARVLMDYGGLEADWDDPRPSILDTEKWVRIIRQKEAESEILIDLSAKGFQQEGHIFQRDIKGTAEVLSVLTGQGWRIEGLDRKPFKGGSVSRLTISSGIDWFDLKGGVSFGEEVIPLPRVIRAFLRGEKTVRLGDGSTGLLPEEWLSRNLPALELGEVGRKKSRGKALRFSSFHALVLDGLLKENEVESVDSRFLEIKEGLKDFSGIKKVGVSPAFKGVLRPYQGDSLGWFAFLKKFGFGGILADDMGLGKTVQVLAWLAGEMENGPSLVVAPTSIVFNWQSEAMRFVPGIKILAYTGNGRLDLIKDMEQSNLVLTTYGLLRRDIEILKDLEFNYVILDESQIIKNSDSQISKTVRLLKARHRLCLTGTPLENHVGELWSQMEFLNPGLLGRRAAFGRKFVKPIAQGDKTALDLLKQMVRAFILRRSKEAVAKEILEKTEQVIFCPMTDRQAKIYSQVRDHYRASVLASVEQLGINKSRIKVLEGLLRLRQAANHPALIGEDNAGSGKLEEIMTLIEESLSKGHKALVFSQFTKMLALIRNSIDNAGIAYEYLDGGTPQARREDKVRRFQEDRGIKLFLISLKAGGLGLNLTAADYVFIVDPWWNPALEIQAVDRTHRIGQDKRVFTYRFITEGTVEEKILALQEKKQEVVSAILNGGQDMLRKLSRKDVEVLFS
ncbi:MAG: hypothetical protein GWP10_00030 [Nitrospiraceae bacterium]|nr:hypothetical protein [Nitrospiraceae bacterium]